MEIKKEEKTPTFGGDVRKHFLTQKNINFWSGLPGNTVELKHWGYSRHYKVVSQRNPSIENVVRRFLSLVISDLTLYMKAVLAKQQLSLHAALQEHAKANTRSLCFDFLNTASLCPEIFPASFAGKLYADFVSGSASCTVLARGPTG